MKLGPLQIKWLELLESGEYKQCVEGALCGLDDDCTEVCSYCCLGLAAVKVLNHDYRISSTGSVRVNDQLYYLSDWLKLGLYSNDGKFRSTLTLEEMGAYFPDATQLRYHHLVQTNDDGATFKQIAKFIRENPERVFTEPK